MSSAAVSSITRDDQNHYLPQPSAGPPALPSAPVIDEDGDGELADEIPLDRNGNGSFLDEGAPAYSDGNQRDDIYYRATLAHVRNVNLTADLVGQAIFRDSTIPGSPYTYADLGPGTKPAEIAASGTAVYNRAGWLDYHARCATQWFASLNGRTPVKLLFAPSVHGGFPGGGRSGAGPYWWHFATPQTERDLDIEKLRFFDRYLKGVDNGIDREPPVYLYVMGSGWRAEQEWPLARAVTQRWYFSDDHALTNRRRGSGIDQYRVDLSADSRHEGANRWNFRLAGVKEPMQATQQDRKRLIYETAPLEGDMEVTGHPLIELAVSSTADDGDFFVYLEDVDPQGRVLSVTDGQLRASFWKQAANDTMVNTGPGRRLDVKPELPWHGFTRAGQDPEVFAHGRVATLKFDLMPTAWLFRKGHRIRVAIAGADWPTFQLHPLLSPQNQPQAPDNLSPTINVHRTKARPSWISLPVIPAD
jgi:putative CocE/NonD family hydrolase